MNFLIENDLKKYIAEESRDNIYYAENYTIRASECDQDGKLHTNVINSLMQEVSNSHIKDSNFSAKNIYSQGFLWILNRVSARFQKHPKWRDEVRIYTWQSGMDRLGFFRDYYMFDSDGQAYGAARSFWTIASADTHKLLSPSTIFSDGENPMLSTLHALPYPPTRLRRNFADFTDAKSYDKVIGYSEIDRNGHMNNTRYVALCRDAAALFHPEGYVSSLDINYVEEVFQEEILHTEACILEETATYTDIAVHALRAGNKESFRAILRFQK